MVQPQFGVLAGDDILNDYMETCIFNLFSLFFLNYKKYIMQRAHLHHA